MIITENILNRNMREAAPDAIIDEPQEMGTWYIETEWRIGADV